MILPESSNFTSNREQLINRAVDFLTAAYGEEFFMIPFEARKAEVIQEIQNTGTWTHTYEELVTGARMAWRNSNRCIGRLNWKSLKIIDARHLETPGLIFDALENHVTMAFRAGQIMPYITVFRQRKPGEECGPRILNNQLISYGAVKQQDGTITGDPKNLEFTSLLETFGYRHPNQAFEKLPVAIQWPGSEPLYKMLAYPSNIEFILEHPEFEWFIDLGIKWYAVPVVSDMLLEIGGVHYTAAPFNGWYMGTEIGSRNLSDRNRYNLLPVVARNMELDTSNERSLWIDKAMVELNRAVLYSFEKNNIKITSHHEAAAHFMHFQNTEENKNRCIHAEWAWIVPPLSPSATPVYHQDFNNEIKTPNYFYQENTFTALIERSKCPFSKNQ
jgi:nitric-oxide synthase